MTLVSIKYGLVITLILSDPRSIYHNHTYKLFSFNSTRCFMKATIEHFPHYRFTSAYNAETTGAISTFWMFNILRPRQNGRHFADDIFKCIFLNENIWILIKISLKFVPKGPINKMSALVQIMVWRRPGDKPLSEPMMVSLLTHICVTRPQWVNTFGSTPTLSECWKGVA